MNGYELIAELEKFVREIVTVPNSWLPEEFRDNRTDCVSLEDLDRKCDARDSVETDHQEEKREKERRIGLYRQMIDNGQEITYLMKGN